MLPASVRRIGRRYRRYRYNNQYDSPLLIFFYDTCFSVAKLLLIALVFYGLWVLVSGEFIA